MSVNDLVKRFAEISMAQAEALEWDEIGEFNRLYTQLDRVGREIQRRGSEDRTKLKGLYLHPSPQVRLNAAKSTLAIAPQEAREVLESICASRRLPQSLDAGMTLSNLDNGIFKPT
jgi:hypothetical protein